MSLGIYPVYDCAVPEARVHEPCTILAVEYAAVDAIADVYGIARMTSFGDTPGVPGDFDNDEVDELGPVDDWFPCHAGIHAFESLARIILKDPASARRLRAPHAAARELKAIAQALAIAAIRDARFHLELR